MLNWRKPALGLVVAVAVTACGVNDGGGRVQGAGQFHDTAVQGLTYRDGARQGLTGPEGQFDFLSSDPIAFSIGDIALGSAPGASFLTPLDLTGGALTDANPAPINIARLLLTLDADCRPSNGILLPAAARAAGSNRSLRFAQLGDAFAADPAVQGFLQAVDQAGGGRCPQLVGFDEALAHLRITVEHIAREGRPNRGPTASVSGPGNAVGGTNVTLNGQGADSDGEVSFRWEQVSGPSVNLDDPVAATTRFTAPDLPAVTLLVFRLTVTDDDGATDSRELSVRIEPMAAPPSPTPTPTSSPGPGATPTPGPTPNPTGSPPPGNRAPQAQNGSFSGPEDEAVEGMLSASDPDGDPLIFALVGDAPGNGALNLSDNGFFRFVPAQDFNGALSFQFRVSDGAAQSAPATVSLTITPVNDPPQANAGAPQSVRSGQAVTLQGSGSDVEGAVSFAWSQISGPTVSLQDADQAAARFTAPDVSADSELVFRLTVTDGEQASDSDTTTVTVSPEASDNLPPAANAGPDASVEEGSEVVLDGSGSDDPDGTIASFAWSQIDNGAPSVALRDADSAQAGFTAPTVTEATLLAFRLQVTDNDGATGADSVEISVTPVNAAPVADAGPDQVREEGEDVSLDGSGSSDPDGSIAAFAWAQVAGSPVSLEAADSATPRFTAPPVEATGELLRFTLTVTDNEGASASDSVEILVRDRPVGTYRVGAAKRIVTPTQAHIDGIEEPRLGRAPHNQRFNLGGFGIDPTQNFPDPIGAFGDSLTAPADAPVHINADGAPEHTWIRAFALSLFDGETDSSVVFLALDAVGAGNVIQDRVKTAIAARSGIAPANILFGQTHSHAGADLQGLWGGVPQDWIESILVPQAAAAVDAALAQRRPVTLSLNQELTNEYNNYRRPRLDADAESDPHLSVLQARALDGGALIGHLLQYSAHPVSINEDPRVPHADYILGAADWLEAQGGVALYFNGPIADASGASQRPGCPVGDDETFRPYQRVRCRGEGIAEVVAPRSKLAIEELPVGLEIDHAEVILPVTNPLFLGAGLLGSFNRYYDFVGLPASQIPGIGPLVADQIVNLPQVAPTATTLVSRIQIGGEGGLEIVTIPGEATNTFGQSIRALAPDKPMLLLGLTQNSFGYILPEEEFSYIDSGGGNGFLLPFTGYEEFVSLGPLTAPLLKLQGYFPLFGASPAQMPDYLAACVDNPADAACILQIEGRRLELTQRFFAQQCSEFGGPDEFCGLLNPDTPLRPLCDTLGLPSGVCGLLGEAGGDPGVPGLGTDLPTQAADAALRGCDLLDPAHCLYPFPSDHFTTAAPADGTYNLHTGRRVNLNPLAMPRNLLGKPVDPTEWNRNDGFSPGAIIMSYVPGLSLTATHDAPAEAVGIADIRRSLSSQAAANGWGEPPILLLEVTDEGSFASREHLHWAELDVNAGLLLPTAELEQEENIQRPDPRVSLLIRPARNLTPGRRYVVVLRNLKNAAGETLAAQPAFAACQAGESFPLPVLLNRCAQLEDRVFPVLAAAGIDSADEDLYLAWDFTVASAQNITGRLTHMRDAAFQTLARDALGNADCSRHAEGADCAAPRFTVDRIDTEAEDGDMVAIEGSLVVPSFLLPTDTSPVDSPEFRAVLDQLGALTGGQAAQVYDNEIYNILESGSVVPPNRLRYLPDGSVDPQALDLAIYGDGLPDASLLGEMSTRYICYLPRTAWDQAGNAARASLYGHGLLQTRYAVTYDGNEHLGEPYNMMQCALDWFGFAQGDLPNVASTLVDFSLFPVIPDASQQGMLNWMFLARAMQHPEGFAAHPAFHVQGDATQPLAFDRREVFYYGNSQGGILPGPVVAVSKDINRGVFGVPGMNYSTLLRRSSDFGLYSVPLYIAYQDELDRNLIFGLMPMLWDRGENNGFAAYLTAADGAVHGGLPGNANLDGQDNDVLLHPAYGDHQVSSWSAEVMARTANLPTDSRDVCDNANRLDCPRHQDVLPYFDSPELEYADPAQRRSGAQVVWDRPDTVPPPIVELPPHEGPDPHGYPRGHGGANCQMHLFLQVDGYLADVLDLPQDRDTAEARCFAEFDPVITVQEPGAGGGGGGGGIPPVTADELGSLSSLRRCAPGDALCPFLSQSGGAGFKAGAARIDSTPGFDICTGGYGIFCDRHSDEPRPNVVGGRDRLYTRALVIESEGERIALVTTTAIGLFASYKARLGSNGQIEQPPGLFDTRARLGRETGLPLDHVFIQADHSHFGPDTIGIWGSVPTHYLERLSDDMVRAVKQALDNLEPAELYVGAVDGAAVACAHDGDRSPLFDLGRNHLYTCEVDSLYSAAPNAVVDHEFRLLEARRPADGSAIAIFANYSPHATVLDDDSNPKLSGDWTGWFAEMADSADANTIGLATVGALGRTDFDSARYSGEGLPGDDKNLHRERDARARLKFFVEALYRSMPGSAVAGVTPLQPLRGSGVDGAEVFLREPVTNPIFYGNYAPYLGVPDFDGSYPPDMQASIDRNVAPPFLTGNLLGTFAGAFRIGDVFFATAPGEEFPNAQACLRDGCADGTGMPGRIIGGGTGEPQMHFFLGATNDFLGYMGPTLGYDQVVAQGALYLAGCPIPGGDGEVAIRDALNPLTQPLGYDAGRLGDPSSCPDHFILMSSPSIGDHVNCAIQTAAQEIGFGIEDATPACVLLSATDDLLAPGEAGELPGGPVGNLLAQALAGVLNGELDGAAGATQGALFNLPPLLQDEIDTVINPPDGIAKAGVAVVDMTPDVGYCAGQYCDTTNLFDGLSGGAIDPFATHTIKHASYGVQSRLTARAIVVEGVNGQRIALVKTDNYLAQDTLIRRVAQILEARGSAISHPDILHHVTHNHSSSYSSTPSWGVAIFQDAFDPRFFENQARQIAAAILAAEANLVPARMGATTVRHRIYKGNVTRLDIARDGTPAGYPLEYGDQGLVVMRFDDISEPQAPQPLAVWVNFGEHPESLDGYDLHSADFLAAFERFVDRDLGVPVVFSQGDVGSAENTGNACQVLDEQGNVIVDATASLQDNGRQNCDVSRAPLGTGVWRDWEHEGYVQTERNVRYLADAVIEGFDLIADPARQAEVQVPFSSAFVVDERHYWAPGPVSHPYPAVSNCSTERTVNGDIGVPIAGLPDCSYNGAPFGQELFTQAGLLFATANAEGIPLPDHYDASAFTGVEENVRMYLQTMRIGEVLLASCACEAQVDLILNLETRTDRIRSNIYDGFDFACLEDSSGDGLLDRYRDDPNDPWAAACEIQKDYFPVLADGRTLEYPTPMRGSFGDAAAVARMRAQIHNDARNWDAPENAIAANSEPAAIEDIWGNFTKEELPPEQGYTLPVGVGHAGDYNGYTVSYREFVNRDHYRKALTAYGPHTADYMVTRLVRMAGAMNGGPELAPEVGEAVAQADEARQAAETLAIGQGTGAAYDLWQAAVPLDVGPAEILAQPVPSLARFGANSVRWRGGNPQVDNPFVVVEKRCSAADLAFNPAYPQLQRHCQAAGIGAFAVFAEPSGEVPTRLFWPQGLPGVLETYTGQFGWQWLANFEAYEAFPARLGDTPLGEYRFAIAGCINDGQGDPTGHGQGRVASLARGLTPDLVDGFVDGALGNGCPGGALPYGFTSNSFTVTPFAGANPPNSYVSEFPFIEDQDFDRFCVTCSFRPWRGN